VNIGALRTLAFGLVASTAFAAQPANADPTTTAATAQQVAVVFHMPVTVELPRFQTTRPTSSLPTLSRAALYVLQAFDSVQSARALRFGGAAERNALMRPFSHAGAGGMALGFALGDVLRDVVLRRSPKEVKLAADAAQAASNLEGILATRAAVSAALHP
jgi:hypothetical protein